MLRRSVPRRNDEDGVVYVMRRATVFRGMQMRPDMQACLHMCSCSCSCGTHFATCRTVERVEGCIRWLMRRGHRPAGSTP